MNVKDAIFGRRSIRDYTVGQPVDEQAILQLIEAAVYAPNALNEQPWIFTVLRDKSVLDQISHAAKTHMLAAMPAGPQSDRLRPHLNDPDFHIFYHAPALIVISAAAPCPWAVENCALAAENMMLSAYSVGLGTCWVGLAQGYLNTPEGKRLLGLAAESTPVAPIAVGHPRAVPIDVPRRNPDVHWIG